VASSKYPYRFKVPKENRGDLGHALKQTFSNYFEETCSYSISFTTDSDYESSNNKSGCDRLSQWRGYASNKHGFCLVFGYTAIEDLASNLVKSIRLSGWLKPCIYKDDDKIRLAKDVITPAFSAYAEEIKNVSPSCTSIRPFGDLTGNPMKAVKSANIHAIFLYSVMKDASFNEECETRLSVQSVSGIADNSLIHFRDGKDGKVPYIEIPIGIRTTPTSLKKIVVGPSPDKEQVTERLKIQLDQMGLSHIKVIPSRIPFRNW
jgi:hypothetical protein